MKRRKNKGVSRGDEQEEEEKERDEAGERRQNRNSFRRFRKGGLATLDCGGWKRGIFRVPPREQAYNTIYRGVLLTDATYGCTVAIPAVILPILIATRVGGRVAK